MARGIRLNTGVLISIHAPREGSDKRIKRKPAHLLISIHAPREGSDQGQLARRGSLVQFLSTLPARGATHSGYLGRLARGYFYPRSPRGERPSAIFVWLFQVLFLSTLPARGATDATACKVTEILFLSTLPARGATATGSSTPRRRRFLSTLPARGATAPPRRLVPVGTIFLSTLPARGATLP